MNRIEKIIFGLFLISIFGCSEKQVIQKKPNFITTDIDLFWKVFDDNNLYFESDSFKMNYVNKGSIGLKDFDELKNICPELERKLRQSKYLNYYNSIRDNTTDLTDEITISKEAYITFEDIYSGFKQTDVYFLVGALTAGGKKTDNGLLIGVEFFTKSETTSTDQLNEWYQKVLKEKIYLPSIVIHELVHFQQNFIPKYSSHNTLLEQSIMEGMADYISYKIINDNPFFNEHLHYYADSIENQLWDEFKKEMDLDYKETDWLYNGGGNSSTVPADLGYYVGFKIIESFVLSFNNESDAIEAMLNNYDYYDIFEKSNYETKFQ
jgi:hypothetical protein